MLLNIYGQLDDCQTRIYNALLSNNRADKESAYIYAVHHVSNLKADLDAKWHEWSLQGRNRQFCTRDLDKIDDESLDLNLRFCIEVINGRINRCTSAPISPYAIQTIFFSPEPLQRSTVLYEEKGHDGQERQLKVSDFISVLDYAMKFAEMNSDADFYKYNKAKLAIKTVDLAINHKPVDKPLNKTLHIVNDILTEYAKSIGKDKEAKRDATGISLLVDLAIDFLVRG